MLHIFSKWPFFLTSCSLESSTLFDIFFFPLLVHKAPEVVEKPGDNSLSRLKMLYTQAKELSESEVKYVCYIFFGIPFNCSIVWTPTANLMLKLDNLLKLVSFLFEIPLWRLLHQRSLNFIKIIMPRMDTYLFWHKMFFYLIAAFPLNC